MKLLIALLLLSFISNAQTPDTIIQNSVYTSYFNYQLHEPLYVSYKLWHGGGTCSRAGMRFQTGGVYNSATEADYAHNGYDIGHMDAAENEAGDCSREALTFYFCNALPQTARLNRGVWKHWETVIRKESQTDSLFIVCGGIFGTKYIGNAAVPDSCFKVVWSLTMHKITHCMMFPNDNSDSYRDINITDIPYKLPQP